MLYGVNFFRIQLLQVGKCVFCTTHLGVAACLTISRMRVVRHCGGPPHVGISLYNDMQCARTHILSKPHAILTAANLHKNLKKGSCMLESEDVPCEQASGFCWYITWLVGAAICLSSHRQPSSSSSCSGPHAHAGSRGSQLCGVIPQNASNTLEQGP